MPKPEPIDQAELSEQAWKLSREAMERGTLTLTDPLTSETRVIDLLSPDKDIQSAARNVLTHIRWMAHLTARRKPRTNLPALLDSARLPETR